MADDEATTRACTTTTVNTQARDPCRQPGSHSGHRQTEAFQNWSLCAAHALSAHTVFSHSVSLLTFHKRLGRKEGSERRHRSD